jgi:hypothetical protein
MAVSLYIWLVNLSKSTGILKHPVHIFEFISLHTTLQVVTRWSKNEVIFLQPVCALFSFIDSFLHSLSLFLD